MKLASHLLWTAMLGAVSGVVFCTGCQDPPASEVTAVPREESPEKSFNEIAKQIAQSVQTGAGGMPGSFIAREPDGHSRLVIKNDVKHEFLPPKKEGEPYRGLITVTSKFDYSIQRVAGGGEQEDERGEDADKELENGNWQDGGATILDNDLVQRSESRSSRKSESEQSEDLIARRSDEDVSTYELAYENNRWVLKTQLNPDTEQAIKNAFDHILSLQP